MVATSRKSKISKLDDLIAKDKTISSYARTLDEELVELEIRINRNPDEDMDGPMKNPIFDVLSRS
jgi:hypothetical protein